LRPRVHHHERIAAIDKLRLTAYDLWTLCPERMTSAKLRAKAIIRNVTTPASGPGMPLLIGWLLRRFLPTLFLPACFMPVVFRLPLAHISTGLRFLLSLIPLLRSRGLRLILAGSLHVILPRFRFGLRLFLPLRFFLAGFVFLLFFILCVQNRRTREQSRE